jgi:hypothetical protein
LPSKFHWRSLNLNLNFLGISKLLKQTSRNIFICHRRGQYFINETQVKPSAKDKMRFTSLTVSALLLANSYNGAEGFSVRPPMAVAPRQNIQMPTQAQRVSPLNFAETSGGMEELQELLDTQATSPLEKQVRKSPSFWRLAGYASIPVSAALGFGLVPSRRLAAHAAGALVTGVAGAIGKSRLDAVTEAAAFPAIAQTLVDNGLDDPSATAVAIQEVKNAFGIVNDEDFDSMCADVYGKYLLGMVKFMPTAKTSEMKELENLKNSLGLSNLQVGEAHAAAAAEWYRTTCLFTPEEDLEDPGHPDRQAMDKFIFLTERALRQGGETAEAFNFEMTRVARAFKITLADVLERVAEVQEPFYQRALKSTRAKLGTNQVSGAMLERARMTLGISEETAFDLHVTSFNEEVKELLGLGEDADEGVDSSTLKFGEGADERVSTLGAIGDPHPLQRRSFNVLNCIFRWLNSVKFLVCLSPTWTTKLRPRPLLSTKQPRLLH